MSGDVWEVVTPSGNVVCSREMGLTREQALNKCRNERRAGVWVLARPATPTAKRKLAALLNRLALRPTRTCRYMHECCLCPETITDGQQYKDAGLSARAHLSCFGAARGMCE